MCCARFFVSREATRTAHRARSSATMSFSFRGIVKPHASSSSSVVAYRDLSFSPVSSPPLRRHSQCSLPWMVSCRSPLHSTLSSTKCSRTWVFRASWATPRVAHRRDSFCGQSARCCRQGPGTARGGSCAYPAAGTAARCPPDGGLLLELLQLLLAVVAVGELQRLDGHLHALAVQVRGRLAHGAEGAGAQRLPELQVSHAARHAAMSQPRRPRGWRQADRRKGGARTQSRGCRSRPAPAAPRRPAPRSVRCRPPARRAAPTAPRPTACCGSRSRPTRATPPPPSRPAAARRSPSSAASSSSAAASSCRPPCPSRSAGRRAAGSSGRPAQRAGAWRCAASGAPPRTARSSPRAEVASRATTCGGSFRASRARGGAAAGGAGRRAPGGRARAAAAESGASRPTCTRAGVCTFVMKSWMGRSSLRARSRRLQRRSRAQAERRARRVGGARHGAGGLPRGRWGR